MECLLALLIPVKGIWFGDLEKTNTWLAEQHPRTAEVMARKLVEIHFSKPTSGEKVTQYFVMAGLAGYVNC